MTKPEKNKGKPETRKRKLADSDEESGEEEAAQKTASKKNKRPERSRSESNVPEDSDDFLIANYARLGLNDRRDEKGDSEEKEATSNKRKTDNSEGPAAKKPKKAEGMRGKSKYLFVKNLSINTDEYSLMAAFDGAVSARIPTFQHTGYSRGYGFVDFSSAEAAADAFDSMNGKPVDGRRVTLEFGICKGPGGGGFGVRGDRRRPRGGFNKVKYSSRRNRTVRGMEDHF